MVPFEGSAYRILKKTFKLALVLATLASLGALVTGHFSADIVAHYQPAKLAALEGHYKTGPAKMYLFGIPDNDEERVRMGVGIPGGLSFLVHWNWDEPVTGLDAYPEEDWPNVGLVFQTYHAMVALGILFIFISFLGLFYWWRGTLFEQRWLLWSLVLW